MADPRASTALLLALELSACAASAAPKDQQVPVATGHAITTLAAVVPLIDEGIERSPTFAHLVEELDASDVVVEIEPRLLVRPRLAGYMVFVTRTSIRRYLRIFFDMTMRRPQQIAMIGHELCHAVEVAHDPRVVSDLTLRDLYARIGFARGNRWDSDAAIDAGYTIAREIAASSSAYRDAHRDSRP